ATAAGDLTFVDQNGVTLRYNLNGTALQRTENGVVSILIGGVQSLALTYRDSNGAVTGAPANVANIMIAITTQPQAANPCAASAPAPTYRHPTGGATGAPARSPNPRTATTTTRQAATPSAAAAPTKKMTVQDRVSRGNML